MTPTELFDYMGAFGAGLVVIAFAVGMIKDMFR